MLQAVPHVLRNNVAFDASNNLNASVNVQSNSWTLPVVVDASDFESLDVSSAASARGNDGSLPALTLLALRANSDLIDRGTVLLGSAFNGAAPDLGAREFGDFQFLDGFEN
jgi:hypothetical protein